MIETLDILKNSIIVGEDSLKNPNEKKKIEMVNSSNLNMIPQNNISTWKPSETGNKRILFCGTYPIGQSNGYSRVVYYISKFLGEKEDIDLTIYGFQKFWCYNRCCY